MSRLAYLAVLVGVVLATLPLELLLRTRVLRRRRRLALTMLPVLVVFVSWDLYAIGAGHWSFDRHQIVGLLLPGGLPVEELLFFLVVPLASVLALEAVRRARGWRVGDEG